MRKTLIGTAYYKTRRNTNGTKRIVVSFDRERVAQRTAAYISGDFVGDADSELARAQHAVGVQHMVNADPKQG